MLLKNAHLRRFLCPSSLRRTLMYDSFLGTSGALHLGIFEQHAESDFFRKLQVHIPSDLIDTLCLIEYTPEEKKRKRM
jgi:hypothetical protein